MYTLPEGKVPPHMQPFCLKTSQYVTPTPPHSSVVIVRTASLKPELTRSHGTVVSCTHVRTDSSSYACVSEAHSQPTAPPQPDTAAGQHAGEAKLNLRCTDQEADSERLAADAGRSRGESVGWGWVVYSDCAYCTGVVAAVTGVVWIGLGGTAPCGAVASLVYV